MGPVVRPDVYPHLTAGDRVDLVCVVISPSSQGRSHLGVMLAPVGDACMKPYLWSGFGWTSAKGEFAGECKDGCMELESFALVCCGRDLECLGKFLPRVGWMAGL